jgi:hypothetical protein
MQGDLACRVAITKKPHRKRSGRALHQRPQGVSCVNLVGGHRLQTRIIVAAGQLVRAELVA